jgi:hypothetical protein
MAKWKRTYHTGQRFKHEQFSKMLQDEADEQGKKQSFPIVNKESRGYRGTYEE